MSVANLPQTFTPAIGAPAAAPTRKSVIIVEDKVTIPAWVDDRESFRWAYSDEYPNSGWISYLQGELWVDMTMEELLTHNQVKFAIYLTLASLLQKTPLGRFVPDRMLYSNDSADISTEPDGLFFFWETVKSKRIRFVQGINQPGIMELSGTPDMVLEVVSRTSVRKDTVRLRDLYWQASIPEYWLVDVRGDSLRFEILRHTAQGYETTPAEEGWIASSVFGQALRLTQAVDPLGHPLYTLEMRAR